MYQRPMRERSVKGAADRARRRKRRLLPLLDAALCVGAAALGPGLRLRARPPRTPIPDDVVREVLALAEAERVDAIVARGLRTLGAERELLRLSERERAALAQSLSLHHARAQLSTALDGHGVPHVYLKGTLSDALFWRGTGVRGVTDIDLLISPEDEPHAHAALLSLGLSRPMRVGAVTDRVSPERLYGGELRGRPINLDLHVGVCRSPPYREPSRGIVARRRVYETRLGAIPGPAPEDALLHATLNLATAKFFSGRWKLLLDAACWLSRDDVELETFAERARRTNAGWAAWALLSLVRERFLVEVPEGVMRALEPRPTQRVLAERLAGIGCVPRVPSSRAARVLVEWPLVNRPLWPAELLFHWVSWKIGDRRHR